MIDMHNDTLVINNKIDTLNVLSYMKRDNCSLKCSLRDIRANKHLYNMSY